MDLNSKVMDLNSKVMDLNSTVMHYTWNQKPKEGGGVLNKLDRIMSNIEFIGSFPGAYTIFQPYRISDHSPAVLKIPGSTFNKPKPFKFFNFISFKSQFLEVVSNSWNNHVTGHNMFKVVSKLKALKKPLSKMVYDQGNLHDRVNNLRRELDEVQTALDANPDDINLREEAAIYLHSFNEAKLAEDENDNVFSGSNVVEAFVSHYDKFLGSSMACDNLNSDGLFHDKVSDVVNANMVRPVSDEEIKMAMFSIGDNKSPGPDGYTFAFFKKAWDVVGMEICDAVRDFFLNGQILKEINHTFIALISKIPTPLRINDYQPISCCNMIYKCISKILTNRIIEGVSEVVSENQSAFIPGRNISDNILITQELMHNYHRKRGYPRCAFKVDIQKAYDTVDWRFLENILEGFGFHPTMIKWTMACVTSTSFSISLNGDIHGYFKGKRGLRQGDPLSPYLFTLVMEVLTLMLKKRVDLSESFRYHHHCENLQIINVCFADDLFLFARGNVESAMVIMESLDEFKSTSGLVPSISKSTAFFCNVVNHVKTAILNVMPFSEGTLPVKYLGVHLISSRLLNKDCKVLVEHAKNRIGDWKNKSLSFAGRLQLCKSVISSMQVYWASVIAIPKGIIYDIQQLILGFLWCNGESCRGKAKVVWVNICLPTREGEGGLGLRSLDLFNQALMSKHIWNIVTNKESLWVRWIHSYKLRGRSFWAIPLNGVDMSWGWRKLLQLRVLVRPYIWTKLGNSNSASAWHDTWDPQGPLIRLISPSDISSEGFSLTSLDACSSLVGYGYRISGVS
ncbi:hypothetical protein Tco_1309952 [Tanacetum coccineum]